MQASNALKMELGEVDSASACLTSDLANARRFVRKHRGVVLYAYKWEKWLVYDGKRWAVDDSGRIFQLAKAVVESIFSEIGKAEKHQRDDLYKWAKTSQSAERIRGMLSLVKDELPVLPEDLDRDPMLINLENCVLDLKTMQPLPHDPKYLITKLANATFDPAAICPTWEAFVDEITLNRTPLANFMQEFSGYSLTGLTREQCFVIGYGTGANGKTTFVDTIAELMGDYAQRAAFSTFLAQQNDRVSNDIAGLAGARLVQASEVEDGRRFNESLIKEITGGEKVNCRFLYGEFFEYAPQYKLWLSANHKPVIRGTDYGIWRRVKLIPFDYTVPEDKRDANLRDKLRAEMSGILNWCTVGLANWLHAGLSTPAEVKAATEAYRIESDVLGTFIEDCCILASNATSEATPLYKVYKAWAEENGLAPMSQQAFGRRLTERGLVNARDSYSGRKRWSGIGILQGQGIRSLNDTE